MPTPMTHSPKAKHSPHLEFEIQAGYPKRCVVGADEVGRGCIAGPVVAAAVVLPSQISWGEDSWISEIADSKKLTAQSRERLAPLISSWAKAWAIGVASVEEIAQFNIFHASHLAMVRAIEKLKKHLPKVDHVLVDGKFLPREGLACPATAIIKGDQQSLSIAAASILAKVWRDAWMTKLDSEYPLYGFAQHKGYPTPAHAAALRRHGASAIHRRSFQAVAKTLAEAAARIEV